VNTSELARLLLGEPVDGSPAAPVTPHTFPLPEALLRRDSSLWAAWTSWRGNPERPESVTALRIALDEALRRDDLLRQVALEAASPAAEPPSPPAAFGLPPRLPHRTRWFAAAAAVAIIVTAASVTAAITGSSGQGTHEVSHTFYIPNTEDAGAVRARVSMTIVGATSHPRCGTQGATGIVYPLTLTVHNGDTVGWQSDADRASRPGLDLALARAVNGPFIGGDYEHDPFIVVDRNCRPYSVINRDFMEIPAGGDATIHLEVQASHDYRPQDLEVAVILWANVVDKGIDASAAWAVGLDGTDLPAPPATPQ
jgi:hypothetical protein